MQDLVALAVDPDDDRVRRQSAIEGLASARSATVRDIVAAGRGRER